MINNVIILVIIKLQYLSIKEVLVIVNSQYLTERGFSYS